MTQLSQRNAIITGAGHGFGKAIARAYALAGANIVLCGRHEADLSQAQTEILAASPGADIAFHVCDVSRPDDVERLAGFAIDRLGRIDALVNNAGIYGPMGPIEEVDWGEWVQAIEINLFGAILMCRAILPRMKSQSYGKIVNISGGGATNPMPRHTAYAASKAALVRFTESLALDVQGDHIDVNAVAPGALNTRLLDQTIEAGPDVVGEDFYARMMDIKARGGTPLEVGADLCVYLASAASDGITGKLISAVWDPWRSLASHAEDLKGDIYTLRRITPADRGQTWDKEK